MTKQWTETKREAMDFMLYAEHREFLLNESVRPGLYIMREFVQEGMERGEIRRMDVMAATSCLFDGAIRPIITRLGGLLAEPLPDRLDDVWECA